MILTHLMFFFLGGPAAPVEEFAPIVRVDLELARGHSVDLELRQVNPITLKLTRVHRLDLEP